MKKQQINRQLTTSLPKADTLIESIQKKERAEKERAVVRQLRKTQRLLNKFGIQVYGFDPGVRGYMVGDGVNRVDFDRDTWNFIEPLLKELLKYRKMFKALKWKDYNTGRKHEGVCKKS